MRLPLLELTTEEAALAFNIASRIIYFETHSEAASYTVHRYESNHITKTDNFIMSHDDELSRAGILPKNIQAKYLIVPSNKSDNDDVIIYDRRKLQIVIMIYKSDDKEKEKIIVKDFPRVFADSSYSRYVFIPEYYLNEGYQPNINSSISAIMQAIFFGETSESDTVNHKITIVSVFSALLRPNHEIDSRYKSLQPVVDSLAEYLKPDQYVPNNVLSHPVVDVLEEYMLRIVYPDNNESSKMDSHS